MQSTFLYGKNLGTVITTGQGWHIMRIFLLNDCIISDIMEILPALRLSEKDAY
jgi:hypothetical protein